MKKYLKWLLLPLLIAVLLFGISCTQEQEGEAEPVAVTKVKLNKTSLELNAGDTYTLKATASPTEAPQDFVWTSSSSSYASVTDAGVVTVKNSTDSTQTVKITATSKSDSTKKAVCTITVKVKTTLSKIGMITSGPGEDSSTSIVISWHSPTQGSYLEYSDANGDNPGAHVVANAQCHEALSTADWADVATHYRCEVVLTGLTPDSVYKYQIKDSAGTVAGTATFKTAGTDGAYSFMWLSDLHTPSGSSSYINRIKELIDYAEAKPDVDIDFCLFSGDMVKKGQIYKHWNYWSNSGLMKNMVYAFLPGNHDYYGHNDKTRTTNAYFMDVCAYPDNNVCNQKSAAESNYWFIWNKVLFVCADSVAEEGKKMSSTGTSVEEMKAWFEEVVKANAGNYDYLVFVQHYPLFTEDEPCDWGTYDEWRGLFDQYKVDFALSSDYHEYLCTKPLYNDAAVALTDGKVTSGTVYITSYETEGDSIGSLTNTAKETDKYALYNGGGEVGGVYFTVTPTEMTMHLIGAGGAEKQTLTVVKKAR